MNEHGMLQNYKVLDSDDDSGLYIVKLDTGEIVTIYNIGYDNERLYYNFSLMNEKEDTNIDKLTCIIKEIVNDIYFKEEL